MGTPTKFDISVANTDFPAPEHPTMHIRLARPSTHTTGDSPPSTLIDVPVI